MSSTTHYKITTPRGRTWKRHMTDEEKRTWEAQGYTFEAIEATSVVPARAEPRQKGLRENRTGKPFARIPSGLPTGPGSLFTHMEQHYRPEDQPRGRVRIMRFRRTEGM